MSPDSSQSVQICINQDLCIPVCLTPDDLQGEHNIPPDNENGGNGGGIPPIPYGQVPWQHMQPQQPPQPPLPPQSPESKDEDDFYALKNLIHHNAPLLL